MKNMNFFESVAHHNLERFHSECISWAFNSSEKMLLNFLENAANHDNILDILQLFYKFWVASQSFHLNASSKNNYRQTVCQSTNVPLM